MKTTVRVPEKRMSCVLGEGNETLKKIERLANVNLKQEKNSILISNGSLSVWRAKKIIKAIARGFSPSTALKLLNEKTDLEVINLKDYISGRKNIKRVKGRIIGKEGKTKKIMENLTGSEISIYGDTVSVISNEMMLPVLKKALSMLIEGSKHATVYRHLEKEIKKM